MTAEATQWFVLAGGLSPYTVALWERVIERSGHLVTIAHTPRGYQADFAHEGEHLHSRSVSLVAVDSLKTVSQLAFRCITHPNAAIVCMGHGALYNVAISALARTLGSARRHVLYMSDTNGLAMIARTASSERAELTRLLKRALLRRTFTTSFDLGFSNTLAHQMLGIRRSVGIPLLAVDFPTSLEPEVPPPLDAMISALPRPRLLVLARLVPCKNLVELSKAFVATVRDGMAGSLTIVGEGPERGRIEPILGQVPGRALLAGAVPFRSSRRLFGAFDGMLLTSVQEPWGIVIIEGLGWGLPVLSTRPCGAGISMALERGDAVKLCGSTKEELKLALLEFVGGIDRRTALARLGAPAIRARFGMTQVADQLIAFGKAKC